MLARAAVCVGVWRLVAQPVFWRASLVSGFVVNKMVMGMGLLLSSTCSPEGELKVLQYIS